MRTNADADRRSDVRPIEEVDDELIATPVVPSVLVVDDHLANLLALEGLLEPLGVRAVRASSGEEALKRLLTEDFALILMDVQMPGIDGIEAATMIKERERTRHIPIIFLTAISKDAAHVFRGYEEGAVDYLFKPFDPQILRMKVAVFVELYKRGETIKRQHALLRRRERERLEAENLRRSRELLDAMLDGVMLLDPVSLRFLYANEGATRHLGRSADELAGMSFVDVQTLDGARVRAMAKELVEGRAEAHQYATELRTADGGTVAVDVVLQRIGSSGAELVAVVRDVTERVRIEDELRRANETKDEFLAAASHELRTPLAAAKAQVQLGLRRLRDRADDGTARSLGITSQQIDRMTKLVEDLLDVSRIESGRLSLQLARFDLAASVREICDRVQPLTDQHRITVEAPASLEITGDRDRLEQVLNNLLTNAIRYSPKGGPIGLELKVVEDGVTLAVTDRGVGIPADKQAVIFERFGRAHGARYGGLGLGLTISSGIVQQHGGSIEVESSGIDGEGSTFRVKLPRT